MHAYNVRTRERARIYHIHSSTSRHIRICLLRIRVNGQSHGKILRERSPARSYSLTHTPAQCAHLNNRPIFDGAIGDGMPRVSYFEIAAEKPERAVKFYEKVFGWKIVKWKGPIDHWSITTGGEDEPGIDGGLGRKTESTPSQVDYIVVSSIDEFINKVKDNEGTIVTPKQPIPTVGYYAYFKDPENNTFGLMEYDESAR